MTVAEEGVHSGVLNIVTSEANLDTDEPLIDFKQQPGVINADLTIGVDVGALRELRANDGMANNGVLLAGKGFVLDSHQASTFGGWPVVSPVIKPYVDGRDLTTRISGRYVIDLFGLSEDEVRKSYPAIYQYLLESVLPHRQANNRKSYREKWWQFAEPRSTFRPALAGLFRYIATTETSKHRFFQFLDKDTIPDHMAIAIASDDAIHLGILSARFHTIWALRAGGWLGVGNDPRYTKTLCFDPYPFPDATREQGERIREFAEELDALRKRVMASHDFLTMTKLYNVRAKLLANEPLDESDKSINEAGCVLVMNKLHDQIDRAVADAYGWPVDIGEDDVFRRLAHLNKERVDDENRGVVRWLRPEYQAARTRVAATAATEQIEADLGIPPSVTPLLPKDDAQLVAMLRKTLRDIGKPAEPDFIAQQFRDGGRGMRRVERGLKLLAAAGVVRRDAKGWFLPAD